MKKVNGNGIQNFFNVFNPDFIFYSNSRININWIRVNIDENFNGTANNRHFHCKGFKLYVNFDNVFNIGLRKR